jgi:uncharacterized membrane protein
MGLSETLKKSFVAGIALVAPLVVTVVAFQIIFGWLRGLLNPIIQGTGLVTLTGNIEILGELGALLILFASIATLGYVAQRSAGAYAFGLFDRLIGLIPMVRVIYSSIRQVSDALISRGSRYESVVLVEWPRDGLHTIGFVTSERPGAVADALDERAYSVYLPNSPNPTQGHYTLVPTDQITDVDISVSRAIRLLVTTGIVEDETELAEFQEDVESRLGEENISADEITQR